MRPVPTWRFEIEGACTSKLDKRTLVIANHQSFLDIPLLYLLPWTMKWVTKRSMRKIPILGWMIAMTGHIPIDRKSLGSFHAMDQLIEPIRKGIPGMIFPEGTRSRDGNVQSLKRGAFKIAQKYDFQILPVVLSGGFHAMPPESWKFRFHTQFVISVLNPIQPTDFEEEAVLRNHVQQLMQTELAHIQAKYD
jgi:1-acyl-sn-glycerol-3-phosphate acyltransferase